MRFQFTDLTADGCRRRPPLLAQGHFGSAVLGGLLPRIYLGALRIAPVTRWNQRGGGGHTRTNTHTHEVSRRDVREHLLLRARPVRNTWQ